jgi:hypothetical protein
VHIIGSSSIEVDMKLSYPMLKLLESHPDEEILVNNSISLNSNYTMQLMRELRADGTPMPNLFQINRFDNSTTPTTYEDIMNTLALVHTVNLNSENMNETLSNIPFIRSLSTFFIFLFVRYS